MSKVVNDFKKNNELNKLLMQWTSKNKYNVIFDSTEEEVNSVTLTNKLKNKCGLMIICFYESNVFGSFNSIPPQEDDQKFIIKNDKKHFIFSYNTLTNKGDKYVKIDQRDNSLILYSPPKQLPKSVSSLGPLLQCYGAFTLESDLSSKRSQIDYSFPGNYDLKKGVTADIFINQKYFVYDSLIVLEWV